MKTWSCLKSLPFSVFGPPSSFRMSLPSFSVCAVWIMLPILLCCPCLEPCLALRWSGGLAFLGVGCSPAPPPPPPPPTPLGDETGPPKALGVIPSLLESTVSLRIRRGPAAAPLRRSGIKPTAPPTDPPLRPQTPGTPRNPLPGSGTVNCQDKLPVVQAGSQMSDRHSLPGIAKLMSAGSRPPRSRPVVLLMLSAGVIFGMLILSATDGGERSSAAFVLGVHCTQEEIRREAHLRGW